MNSRYRAGTHQQRGPCLPCCQQLSDAERAKSLVRLSARLFATTTNYNFHTTPANARRRLEPDPIPVNAGAEASEPGSETLLECRQQLAQRRKQSSWLALPSFVPVARVAQMRYAPVGRRARWQSRLLRAAPLTQSSPSSTACRSAREHEKNLRLLGQSAASAGGRCQLSPERPPQSPTLYRRPIGRSLAAVCEKRNKLNSPASSTEAQPQGSGGGGGVTLAVMAVADASPILAGPARHCVRLALRSSGELRATP